MSLETTAIHAQVSIRALVAVHAATNPAAKLASPPKVTPDQEPTADDLHSALDHEAEEDPETPKADGRARRA